MKRAAEAPARPRQRIWQTPAAILMVAALGIAGCSGAGPPPTGYVLGAIPSATAAVTPETGLPIVEVKRIGFPDYLDTTDILERKGNRLIPRPDGRWGERLSLGMTRALTASLAAQLPRMAVTAAPPLAPVARQIFIDVAAFEANDDHHVVLAARWTVTGGRRVVLAERASFVEPLHGNDTGDIVNAMSSALAALAARLAAELRRGLPTG